MDSHVHTPVSKAADDQAVGVLTEKEKELLLEHYYTLYPGLRPSEERAKQEGRQPSPENKPAQGEEAS